MFPSASWNKFRLLDVKQFEMKDERLVQVSGEASQFHPSVKTPENLQLSSWRPSPMTLPCDKQPTSNQHLVRSSGKQIRKPKMVCNSSHFDAFTQRESRKRGGRRRVKWGVHVYAGMNAPARFLCVGGRSNRVDMTFTLWKSLLKKEMLWQTWSYLIIVYIFLWLNFPFFFLQLMFSLTYSHIIYIYI